VYWGGLEMILVGLVCIVFCFLYTTHLSYLGLGDVLVLLFFGIVPVCFTYFVQHRMISGEVLWASIACGIVIDALLMVNNYRDIRNDQHCGKGTLAVRLGARNSRILYLAIGFVAFLMGILYLFTGKPLAFLLPILYLFLHISAYRKMVMINEGRALNAVLGTTARNIFIYGVLLTLGILL
jgi:1,4-dihydroxy-2-naphthoate octaprenyltransferase